MRVEGRLLVGVLGSATATHLCITASGLLASCSSSLRYKDAVTDFKAGLNLLQRLRPVTFNWKTNQQHDLGLIAEEVAEVEPLLVTHNKTGAIEGVKYDQLNVVLINAVREQQQLIDQQQKTAEKLEERFERQEQTLKNQQEQLTAQRQALARQQREIETLKNLFAAWRPALGRPSTKRK